jgi:5-formyltetrahydrofolate cyclo-ligase
MKAETEIASGNPRWGRRYSTNVPTLAFLHSGHRLGCSGGFYDRILSGRTAQAFKLGICIAFHLVETTIPIELHDAIMDAVISD